MKTGNLLLAIFLPLVASECPSIAEEPLMYPGDESLFLCADVYMGHGDSDPIQACNTCEPDFPQWYCADGYSDSAGSDQFFPMGSIIVMEGCTFYGFEENNFEGAVRTYVGPATISYVEEMDSADQGGICDHTVYGFDSFQCDCVQKMIDCEPRDDTVSLMSCDNQSGGTVECSYSKTIGTIYTVSTQNSVNVNAAVENQIHIGLRNIFADDLGVSVGTGYDWTRTEDSTYEEAETTTVTFVLEPGQSAEVYQTVGYCDELDEFGQLDTNESYPNDFLITNGTHVARYTTTRDGRLVEIEAPKLGTIDSYRTDADQLARAKTAYQERKKSKIDRQGGPRMRSMPRNTDI